MIGFFEEDANTRSATRLIFVIGSFWNMILCSYLAIKQIAPGTIIAVFSGVEGVLAGLKLGQKAMELKNSTGI